MHSGWLRKHPLVNTSKMPPAQNENEPLSLPHQSQRKLLPSQIRRKRNLQTGFTNVRSSPNNRGMYQLVNGTPGQRRILL
jgi:hypothetical protein